MGLTALGHQAVRNALYPNLAPYLSLLQQQMHQGSNEMKRFEAYKCFGALLQAAGLAIRDRIKYAFLLLLWYGLHRIKSVLLLVLCCSSPVDLLLMHILICCSATVLLQLCCS